MFRRKDRLFVKRNAKDSKKIDTDNQSILKLQLEVMRNSPVHGINHIFAPNRHFLERLSWLVLVMAAIYATANANYIQFHRFLSQPTVVSMRRDFRNWSTNYPAVTACFKRKMDESRINEVVERYWNITPESNAKKFLYYSSFVKLVAEVSFRRNIRLFWHYKDDDSLQNIDLLQLALQVYPENSVKTSGYITDVEIPWETVMTEMGICTTFNSAYSKYQSLNLMMKPPTTGINEPLILCHYLNHQCYVRFTITSDIEFFIHSPLDIVDGGSSTTGEINYRDENDFIYKAIEIKASHSLRTLTKKQRRCQFWDEPISPTVPAYSYGLCQMDCRRRMSLMFCGCRPYFYLLGGGRPCDAAGMACVGRNVEILVNLPKNLANCSCLPQCTEINYFTHSKKFVHWSKSKLQTGNGLRAGINQSLALSYRRAGAVHCALLTPKLRLMRSVIFTLEDLIGSFGGNAALFLGVSLVALLDMAFSFARTFTGCWHRCK